MGTERTERKAAFAKTDWKRVERAIEEGRTEEVRSYFYGLSRRALDMISDHEEAQRAKEKKEHARRLRSLKIGDRVEWTGKTLFRKTVDGWFTSLRHGCVGTILRPAKQRYLLADFGVYGSYKVSVTDLRVARPEQEPDRESAKAHPAQVMLLEAIA